MTSTALRADTRYWLQIDAGTPSEHWLVSSVPGASTGNGNVAQDDRSNVRVTDPTATAAIPEPDSTALIGLAAGGLIVTRKCRRSTG